MQGQAKGSIAVVILVDQEPAFDRSELSEGRTSFLERLVPAGGLEFPLTWAIEDPAHSPLASRLQRLANWHEVSLWARTSWLAWQGTSVRICDELKRRRHKAWSASVPVTSLVTDAPPMEYPWLANVRDFSVVTGCPVESWKAAVEIIECGSARFGEGPWLAPRPIWLSSPTLWTTDRDATLARHHACRMSHEKGTGIVMTRLSEVIHAPVGLGRLIETIRVLENEGKLDFVPLSDCRPKLAPTKHAPQRSALRPAA